MTLWQRVRIFARAFYTTTRDTALAIRQIERAFWIAMVAIAAIGDVVLYLLLQG